MATSHENIESLLEPHLPVIEEGLGDLGFRFRMYAPDHRMRIAGACGIVSETLRQFLETQDYQASVRIRDFMTLQHVITRVEGAGEPTIVDGSYSQFFSRFGMTTNYDRETDRTHFPSERLLIFPMSQKEVVADWAAEVVDTFWRRTSGQNDGSEMWPAKFEYKLSRETLRGLFADLWDASKYEPWQPSESFVSEAANIVARLGQAPVRQEAVYPVQKQPIGRVGSSEHRPHDL